MPVAHPAGAEQRLAPLTTVKQISLRQNIAYWQPITPALAAREGCRRSGLAQKCCLRRAFAFDSDMESGNGRVPEPWCRVTDQMSQVALRWPVQTERGAGNATLEPKPMRLDLGRRLPDDGQRHLRCRAKGGDVAIG